MGIVRTIGGVLLLIAAAFAGDLAGDLAGDVARSTLTGRKGQVLLRTAKGNTIINVPPGVVIPAMLLATRLGRAGGARALVAFLGAAALSGTVGDPITGAVVRSMGVRRG